MMKRNDFERLILSFFIALGIFAVIVAVISFLPLGSDPFPDYDGPMYVTLEEPEPAEPEPAAVPEEPEPSAETAIPERRLPEEEQPRRAEEPGGQPPGSAAAQAPPAADTPQPAAPGTEEEPAGAREETAGGAAGQERDSAAGAGVPGADETETEPLPEQEEPRTAEGAGPGSGRAAGEPGPGDESGRREETEDSGASPEPGSGEAAREEGEEPGMLGDLDDLDRALAQADEEPGDETGEGAERGEQEGTAGAFGSPGSPIDIETLTAKREALHMPKPEIGSDLAENLPRVWEVVVSFTLLPSGYITDLNIEPDSGNTEVDSIIENTIRTWRFEPVDEAAGSVKVLARYRIRVR